MVVWFQEAYGMPYYDTQVQMRAMDWNTAAVE